MTAPMRARRWAWRAAAKLRHLPVAARVLAGLEPGRGWRRFTPTATAASALTVDAGAAGAALESRAIGILREHGVVILTGLADPAAVAAARDELARFLAPFEALWAQGARGEGVSTDGIRWVARRKGTVNPLADPASVVCLWTEEGDDGGNVGVTRADQLARTRGLPALAALIDAPAQARLAAIVAGVHATGERRFDLLKKPGVARPQTAHVDTAGSFFYAFQYLNDMREPADGPYAYLPGSHRREDLLARDLVLNRLAGRAVRDLPALAGRLVPMTGPAGSIVLSCQRGVHGGLPQPAGRVRWALQTTFA